MWKSYLNFRKQRFVSSFSRVCLSPQPIHAFFTTSRADFEPTFPNNCDDFNDDDRKANSYNEDQDDDDGNGMEEREKKATPNFPETLL